MSFLASILSSTDVTLFSQPKAWFQTHGVNILIIVIGAWIVRRLVVALVLGILKQAVRTHPFASETDRRKRVDTLNSLINALSKVGIWLIAITMIIDEIGVNTAPLLASAGVAGVALGIGSQSLIKDFTNGLFIILENQYRVGDYVQFANVQGIVQAITIRSTILRDFDGNIHHVPNSSILVSTNMTFGISGINLDITVPMDTDMDKLEKVINKVGEDLAEDEKWATKIKRKPYFAQVVQFTEKGLLIKIMGDTTPGSQWKVRTELLKRLRQAFAKNKINVTGTTPAAPSKPPAGAPSPGVNKK